MAHKIAASYDARYDCYTATIALDHDDPTAAHDRIEKHYWRNPNHEHWVENNSQTVVTADRNAALHAFLNSLIVNLRPAPATLAAIYSQVKRPR